MRVLKCQISTSKIVICALVLINLLLIGTVVVSERRGHVFGLALERRNMVIQNDQSLPDYWARKGWENTVKKMQIDFDVAFFGNSITCGSDFQKFFPEKKIINLGYGGDNIRGMIRRVPMLQAAHPHKIFIMAGTNDLFHISIDEYEERYNLLLDLIHDSIPAAQIYLQSVLPMNQDMNPSAPTNEKIMEANERIKNIAHTRRMTYIDLYSEYEKNGKLPQSVTKDGVHIKDYEPWAKKIEQFVME